MAEQRQTRSLAEEGWLYCCPRGWLGTLFWGGTLIVFGLMLFLSETGLVPEEWWAFLVAAALIGWGLTLLVSAREGPEGKGWSARR